MFHPLELTPAQRTKASMYIEIRDAYYHLYNNEAETLTANPALREMLNRLYDNFTERFGRLNDKRNLDLIKMDARGTEILSLERYIDGKARKADIFERPVAFNPDEITHADDASEAPCGQPEQVRPGWNRTTWPRSRELPWREYSGN